MSVASIAVESGGLLCSFLGGVAWAGRGRRKPPEDPALTVSACPACGGKFRQWGVTTWCKEASQYEQRRACEDCGLGQRRRVRSRG